MRFTVKPRSNHSRRSRDICSMLAAKSSSLVSQVRRGTYKWTVLVSCSTTTITSLADGVPGGCDFISPHTQQTGEDVMDDGTLGFQGVRRPLRTGVADHR